jgi:sulfane dehydrogenase subunit SoxC
MSRAARNSELSGFEQVAGNGLLHRRALLTQAAAFGGAVSAGVGLTPAAAAPLAEGDWGLAPGDPVPGYQSPSKYAKNVVRTLSSPNFEPRTSQSRTPHHLLDGTIAPNGVFFTIVHDGVPDIDPAKHELRWSSATRRCCAIR